MLTWRSRRLALLLGLLVVLVLAAVFWRLAFTRDSAESILVGHAQATVTRTETRRNTSILVGGIIVVSVGLGILGALVAADRAPDARARRRNAWRAGTASALVAATVATGAVVATTDSPRPAASRGALSHTDFRTTSGFMRAMEGAGLGCTETRPARVDPRALDAVVCSVPWDADIRDGHDDVIVTLWQSGSERDRWLSRDLEEDAPAVVGSTWAATCEFRSTCALIAHRLRSAEG